jgi:hypothetical protein
MRDRHDLIKALFKWSWLYNSGPCEPCAAYVSTCIKAPPQVLLSSASLICRTTIIPKTHMKILGYYYVGVAANHNHVKNAAPRGRVVGLFKPGPEYSVPSLPERRQLVEWEGYIRLRWSADLFTTSTLSFQPRDGLNM